MKKYCVIGSGRQGTAAAYDIISHGAPESLTVIDSNNHNLEKCKNQGELFLKEKLRASNKYMCVRAK